MARKLPASVVAWSRKTATLRGVVAPLLVEFGLRSPDHILEVSDEIASRNPALVHDVDRAVALGLTEQAQDAIRVAIVELLDAEPEWRFGAPTSEDLRDLVIADEWGGEVTREQFAYVANNTHSAYVPAKRAWFRRLLRARRERGQPFPTIVICCGPDGSERAVRLGHMPYQVAARAGRILNELKPAAAPKSNSILTPPPSIEMDSSSNTISLVGAFPMNKVEFHADVLDTLRAEYPELTDAQRRAVAEKIVAKEAADAFPLWEWTNAELRREQLSSILSNMREAEPALFISPPTAEQIFAAKVAALDKQLGDDKGHPAHPANPHVRRTLYRECQALTPDQRAEAAKGLEIPEVEPTPAEAKVSPSVGSTAPKRFSAMTLQELDTEASHRWGGSFAIWSARDRARYHHMLRNSDPDYSEAERIVDEAFSKGGPSNLSPAERRTAFRAKIRLAAAK